jgi:glycosyltransferase involved in cell wall biosynthesis
MENKNQIRIGIVFNFRKGWMGGMIYIVNIINMLNFLDDEDKPEIVLFYNPDNEEYLKDIKYPKVELVKWVFPGFSDGYAKSVLTGKNIFVDEILQRYNLNGMYPVNDMPVKLKKSLSSKTKLVAWIPDLQHKFYPDFLGKKRTLFRELRIKLTLRNTDHLVVSSGDVKEHFHRFYKLKKDLKIHILRFVSTIDFNSMPPIGEILNKYSIPGQYFIVSNQFTNHKNHFAILHALKKVKLMGKKVFIVFTGRMESVGNLEYVKKIRDMVAEEQLEDQLVFLGMIPRADQLTLMKNSLAIVQPSYFEGWNTSIEDAKSMQVPVIASDIAVHREQLEEKGVYFNPNDHQQLADVLTSYKANEVYYGDYQERVRNFAEDFVNVFR